MFVSPVVAVNATKILVAPMPDNRQITIVANCVSSLHDNVMIVPVPSGSAVEFIDLHNQFDKSETLWGVYNQMTTRYEGLAPILPAEPVVGDYRYSYLSNLEELKREVPIPENLSRGLSDEYGDGYGFVICRIGTETISYRPVGYISSRMQNGALFIPLKKLCGIPEDTLMNPRPPLTPAVHKGVKCTKCGMDPIVGDRWQWANWKVSNPPTPTGYNLCNDCYGVYDYKSHSKYPFIHWRHSEKYYQLEHKRKELELLNHRVDVKIYLINAIIGVSPLRYSSVTTDEARYLKDKPRRRLEDSLFKNLPIEHVQEVEVRNLEANKDFIAYPTLQ